MVGKTLGGCGLTFLVGTNFNFSILKSVLDHEKDGYQKRSKGRFSLVEHQHYFWQQGMIGYHPFHTSSMCFIVYDSDASMISYETIFNLQSNDSWCHAIPSQKLSRNLPRIIVDIVLWCHCIWGLKVVISHHFPASLREPRPYWCCCCWA